MERRADAAEDKLRAHEEKRVPTAAEALSKKNRTQERRIKKLTEGTAAAAAGQTAGERV